MEKQAFIGQGLALLTEKLIEAAGLSAIACVPHIGSGDGVAADAAAVEAMRTLFNRMYMDGHIVIGEGERDEAPMLYIGERVGLGGIGVDIAVDPLEGTALCANNKPGAITVLAAAPNGGLLHAPDVYMEKIAVGAGVPTGILDLDAGIVENINRLAKSKGCAVSAIKICLLDRLRHKEMIEAARATGAIIQLISDGDVMASISTVMAQNGNGPDMYYGIGGAPEGVLAAAALKGLGGQMLGRLVLSNSEAERRACDMGCIPGKVYTIEDMVPGDVVFVAAGVTAGDILGGPVTTAGNKCKVPVLMVEHLNGRGDYGFHQILGDSTGAAATHGESGEANYDHDTSHPAQYESPL
ncbi:MAG: class II fructose-bisphosphatase [Proteobacteria bacterium]|nr:class II fructose-bisphosphatase [Pseudomonadota bacterium]